jgi:sensor histidine kinase regulating citrate/malate metabolism
VVPDRFDGVLSELGRNAVKHGGPSPTIAFECDMTQDDEGYVEIEIRDEGSELLAHEQRVLEEGEETPLEHGDNIGLWSVNWITTGIGGVVTTDVDEQGNTVTIQIPTASD